MGDSLHYSGSNFIQPEEFGAGSCAAKISGRPTRMKELAVEEGVEPHSDVLTDYPIDALGPLMGPATVALHEVIRAPVALCAHTVLAAAALVCQALARVEMPGLSCPLALFLITISSSGERKSAVFNAVMRPILAQEEAWLAGYETAMERYNIDLANWRERAKQGKTERSQPSIEEKPAPPRRRQIIAQNPTCEGLYALLQEGLGSVGIFTDEAFMFLGGHAMREETRASTAANLNNLWSGARLDRTRKGEARSVLYNSIGSMHLMGQETTLESLSKNRLFEDLGLLARTLIVCPKSMVGSRQYVEKDVQQEPAVEVLHARYKEILCLLDRLISSNGSLPMPRVIRPSEAAGRVWKNFYQAVEDSMAVGEPNAGIHRFGSKMPEHVLRLAGILALMQSPDATQIDESHMSQATRLGRFYLAETRRVQALSLLTHDDRDAADLLSWLKKEVPERLKGKFFWIAWVVRLGPSRFRKTDNVERLCELMEKEGSLKRVFNIEIEGANRAEAWELVSFDS